MAYCLFGRSIFLRLLAFLLDVWILELKALCICGFMYNYMRTFRYNLQEEKPTVDDASSMLFH
jgi:hypothetical protein